MQHYYTPENKQLTLSERRMIERWLQEGVSNREIARRLAKAPQTILRDYQINSITADNGAEVSRLTEVFDPEPIYYTHPYSSWERRTNENHNRLIRRWLPKGSKNATHQQVASIENWINNYPKKLFNDNSPREFLQNS